MHAHYDKANVNVLKGGQKKLIIIQRLCQKAHGETVNKIINLLLLITGYI